MSDSQSKHYIFSDESGWDADNQYGCLAKVSGTYENSRELHNVLNEILKAHDKTEIKFKDINNHKTKSIANAFLKTSFEYLKASKIKIHVIVWDKHDSRHKIQNRCDIENLKRMYYHNMKNMMKSWNIKTNWSFFPDEFSAIDWENDVIRYIENTNISPKDDFQQKLFEVFQNVEFPKVKGVKELDSKEYPIIQLADLYAGLVRTSRADSKKFISWNEMQNNQNQGSLFEFDSNVSISNSSRLKFEVMHDFRLMAKNYRLGINFSDSKYFKTFNNKTNICIWHYEPQHEFDKAPTKLINY